MTETPESLKASLAEIGAQASQVDRNGQAIRQRAAARIAEVDARLDELRPKAMIDKAAGDEYLALTEERGRLATVTAL